jgi:hypothetical protein
MAIQANEMVRRAIRPALPKLAAPLQDHPSRNGEFKDGLEVYSIKPYLAKHPQHRWKAEEMVDTYRRFRGILGHFNSLWIGITTGGSLDFDRPEIQRGSGERLPPEAAFGIGHTLGLDLSSIDSMDQMATERLRKTYRTL